MFVSIAFKNWTIVWWMDSSFVQFYLYEFRALGLLLFVGVHLCPARGAIQILRLYDASDSYGDVSGCLPI